MVDVAKVDSPPLARRARVRCRGGCPGRRLTSARAESTAWPRSRSSTRSTHLRSRGEHVIGPVLAEVRDDSPPLARRARTLSYSTLGQIRLTSARAESTSPLVRAWGSPPTHLRSRGEHPSSCAAGAARGDSPPLARRAQGCEPSAGRRLRLTSARAESTGFPLVSSQTSSTHLRSRGEHLFVPPLLVGGLDSPPLARRALATESEKAALGRLTSARAENTTSAPTSWRPPAAHLRSRGEHARCR